MNVRCGRREGADCASVQRLIKHIKKCFGVDFSLQILIECFTCQRDFHGKPNKRHAKCTNVDMILHHDLLCVGSTIYQYIIISSLHAEPHIIHRTPLSRWYFSHNLAALYTQFVLLKLFTVKMKCDSLLSLEFSYHWSRPFSSAFFQNKSRGVRREQRAHHTQIVKMKYRKWTKPKTKQLKPQYEFW